MRTGWRPVYGKNGAGESRSNAAHPPRGRSIERWLRGACGQGAEPCSRGSQCVIAPVRGAIAARAFFFDVGDFAVRGHLAVAPGDASATKRCESEKTN